LAGVDDAISRYRVASEANDVDTMMETIAPGAERVSPLSGRMVFRGRDDLRLLLDAVYSTMRELRWREEIGDGGARVVVGDCKVVLCG
jgi:hypothetical protein